MAPGGLLTLICFVPAALAVGAMAAFRLARRRRDRHLDDLQAKYRRKEAIRRARHEAYVIERSLRAAAEKGVSRG